MIRTHVSTVLCATDYASYASLHRLASEWGYSSQKTFARVLASLQKQIPHPIRVIVVGARTKYHRHDIQSLLS